MLPKIPFYFIRHGETDWNLRNFCMGQTDIPLNETGIAQARSAAKIIAHIKLASMVASPLVRAYKTAEIINEVKGLELKVVSDLREANWGEKQGKHRGDDKWSEEWRNGAVLKDGELFVDFQARIMRAISEAILENSAPLLIVSHGGVHRALQKTLGLTVYNTPNCVPMLYSPPQNTEDNWRCEEILE